MPTEHSRPGVEPRLTQRELLRYRALGLLADDDLAEAEIARRARRIRRLRRDLALSYDAIALVVRLIDRIEELERHGPHGPTVRIL